MGFGVLDVETHFLPLQIIVYLSILLTRGSKRKSPRQGPDGALVRRGADCGGVRSWAQAARREESNFERENGFHMRLCRGGIPGAKLSPGAPSLSTCQ